MIYRNKQNYISWKRCKDANPCPVPHRMIKLVEYCIMPMTSSLPNQNILFNLHYTNYPQSEVPGRTSQTRTDCEYKSCTGYSSTVNSKYKLHLEFYLDISKSQCKHNTWKQHNTCGREYWSYREHKERHSVLRRLN